MESIDFIIILLFFVVFGLGIFLVFLVFIPDTTVYEANKNSEQNFKDESLKLSERVFGSVQQFYPNIRFPEKEITYALDPACDTKKEENIITAFSILSAKTVLKFIPEMGKKEPRIRVLCSDISPNSDKRGHFVAGEGGPSELVNVSEYYVILESKISLYRTDSCSEPKVALHEILHALGFNHTSDSQSIMYPISFCNQQLDESIIQEINRLYSVPSYPDLTIDSVNVNRVGSYLMFQINVSNVGFYPVYEANVSVYENGKFIKSFSLTDYPLPIGSTKILSVKNLKVSKDSTNFEFFVESYNPRSEIRVDNNRMEVVLEKNVK